MNVSLLGDRVFADDQVEPFKVDPDPIPPVSLCRDQRM